MDRLARALLSPELVGLRFRVEGRTDSRGAADYNRNLSLRRARAAAAYLTTVWGLPAARLVVVGHGEDRPRDPANPESDVNRRVEIVTLAPPPPDGDGASDSFVLDALTGDGR